MRRVVCSELGSPDVLVIEVAPALEAGPGRVVVDVAAAGVNYVDALFVAGQYQIKPALPFTPGSEVAGVVSAVGEGVSGVAEGDRVLALCGLGGFAEQVDLSPFQLAAVPESLSLAAAAAFTQSYCTARFALARRAALASSETVLVLGAGGGVGQAAVDVAKEIGATVIGAASNEAKRAAARAAGADHVLEADVDTLKDRARELTGGEGVDVVVDMVGGDLAEPALRALRRFGRFVVIGFASGVIPSLPANQVLLRNRSVIGVDWGAWTMLDPPGQADLLSEALDLVAEGRLHPAEPTTYRLDQASAALEDLMQRRVTGKVVLVP